MKTIITNLFFSVLFVAFLSGCVMGRRTVDLEVPTLMTSDYNGLSVSVADVGDARMFQNRPPDPSTPSIDGDVTKMSEADRSRMIGRQRNGYGKAMGDVALPANVTVEQKAQLLIEEGLRSRGYKIGGSDSDYEVDEALHEDR